MTPLDLRALDRLATDVASWPFTVTFAEKYRRLLLERVRRIVSAVGDGDLDRSLDAVLSLRVASSYVGARELVEMAHHVEGRLRSGDLVGARARVRHLPAAAHRTDHALGSYLLDLAPAS